MSTSTPRKKRKTTEDGLWRADDMLDRVHRTDGTRGKASRLRFSRFAPKSTILGSPCTPSRGEIFDSGTSSLLPPIPAPDFPAMPSLSSPAVQSELLQLDGVQTAELPLADWSENDNDGDDRDQHADPRETDEDDDAEDDEDYEEEDSEEEEGLVVAGEGDNDAEGPVVADEPADTVEGQMPYGKKNKKPPAKANNTIVSRLSLSCIRANSNVGGRNRPSVSPPS